MIRARAFWVAAPGRGEVRSEEIAPPGPGEVLVRARASGVSRGSEGLVFAGRVPEGEGERMRCPFQAGAFPAPVKYGYASVGVVEAGPAGLRGRRVFCLHPHQDRYVVPAGAVVPVPDEVPDSRAVLAANMETAVNALWDEPPRVGDRIAVVGAGVVGTLAAFLAARLPGAAVELIDTNPARAGIAAALGLAFARPGAARPEADLVVHASGSAAGLATALALAGFEATVVELSWYGAGEVPAPLGGAFHSRRLTLKSSQVGEVAPARRARRTRAGRLALALALLADPHLDRLLTSEGPLDGLPRDMAAIAAGGRDMLCHVVRYP
ncbi:MAG: zinc-binding alcohol dehydrogenase [Proteobacteria bacterium]|nr:zinc-binding alcohol dehydrogenase [Pseudomonadota bacterium]